ncbi:unnamed protein product [Linum trigynum]|uniref:Methyltransferase type 11 domain-containing protein n=1 Tax=Linum trigynum TaxID=586398 RepID=A0AAV2FLR5_9ROSI
MNLKGLRSQAVTESVAERLFMRCFALALVLSAIPILQYWSGSGSIFLEPIWGSLDCEESVNLTATVVRELTSKQLLDRKARALCVGEGSAAAVYTLHELGFTNTSGGADRHPFFLPRQKKFMYELEFGDNSFDFVFSGDLDKVPVPASLVLEIERVLKPGGVAAALIGGSSNGLVHYNLVRSAMPISSLLKTSSVAHVGYLSGGYTLVVFKKRFYPADYFEHVSLPSECHSVVNNGQFMELLESVSETKPVGFEEKIAYLPKLVDVSARTRMVYVDIGVGEHLKLNSNVATWYLPAYPVDHKSFNVYLVDHNTSVLHSFVKRPGVTFVYHPGLAGDKVEDQVLGIEDLDPFIEDQGFDFVAWFEETVKYADFVVMRLNAGGEVELKFLVELFRSGAICAVDELFLNCSGKGLGNGECGSLVGSLRASGVFVHQWW